MAQVKDASRRCSDMNAAGCPLNAAFVALSVNRPGERGMAQHGQLLIDGDSRTAESAVSSLENRVHEQVRRILSDPLFHNSKRYSDMLSYIVDRTLEGGHDRLKERIIGIEVFERSPDYDTSVDSLVRVAAAEIRKRLSRYYQQPGHDAELRIELPTRSYVAEFKQPDQAIQEQRISRLQTALPEQPPPHARSVSPAVPLTLLQRNFRTSHIFVWTTLAATILVFCAWSMQHIFTPNRAMDKFWAPMLNNPGPILIAVGSPVWIKTSPASADPAPSFPEPGTSFSQFIAHQVNFPMADLTAASSMTTFLGRRGRDSVIRLSDSTTLSDVHGNPLIVLGSFPNEWALRLGANLPFQLRRDAGWQWIEDESHPGDKKWMVNMRSPFEQVTSEYALVTRAFDQNAEQWWIGISGVTVLGTIAAQQIMINPKEMTAFTAQLPKDWDRKNLQIVIEIKLVRGSAGASRVVASRSW